MLVFNSKISGPYSIHFWTMVTCCFVIPVALLSNRKTRTVKGTVVASLAVIVGMYLERYTIVVPTLSRPRLSMEFASYTPTWVEWSLTVSFFSLFILLYLLFTKFFPIVSIWEIQEGRQKSVQEVTERVRGYLPDDTVQEGA